jgi:hypothetical protein
LHTLVRLLGRWRVRRRRERPAAGCACASDAQCDDALPCTAASPASKKSVLSSQDTDRAQTRAAASLGECPCVNAPAPSAPGVQRCTDNGGAYFVRVTRAGSPAAASDYVLRVSNGPP